MSADTSTTKLDVAPLTVIVSEGLDPRVRRKMEAEQQADVKTYQEMTRDMEVQEDLNKIKQEVDEKGEEATRSKNQNPLKTKPPKQMQLTLPRHLSQLLSPMLASSPHNNLHLPIIRSNNSKRNQQLLRIVLDNHLLQRQEVTMQVQEEMMTYLQHLNPME